MWTYSSIFFPSYYKVIFASLTEFRDLGYVGLNFKRVIYRFENWRSRLFKYLSLWFGNGIIMMDDTEFSWNFLWRNLKGSTKLEFKTVSSEGRHMEMEGRGFSGLYKNSSEELFLKTVMESPIGMPVPTMEMLGFKNVSQSFRTDSEELFKRWLTNGEASHYMIMLLCYLVFLFWLVLCQI